jgi:hypothetical protein
MNRLGYHIDTVSSGTLQNSLADVDDAEIRKVRLTRPYFRGEVGRD